MEEISLDEAMETGEKLQGDGREEGFRGGGSPPPLPSRFALTSSLKARKLKS